MDPMRPSLDSSSGFRTPRLRLVPATASMLRQEMEDLPGLSEAIAAIVPRGWPPEAVRHALPVFRARLEAHPEEIGWHAWYWVADSETPAGPILVGSGGFMGSPDPSGAVEIGYGLHSGFCGRGYASEAVEALVNWAFSRGAAMVRAETTEDNLLSLRLLRRLFFTKTGDGADPGTLRFERRRIQPGAQGGGN